MKLYIAAVFLFLVFLAPPAFGQQQQPDGSLSEHAPATQEQVEAQASDADFTFTPVQISLIVLVIVLFVGTLVALATRSRKKEIAGKRPESPPNP